MKYSISIITLLLIFSFTANAQQSYKIFADSSSEKLYYNKHLPVYFWLSADSTDDSQDVLLQPRVKRFANPYYWDTEGLNTVQVKYPKNRYGYKDAVFEVYADGRAPVVSLHFSPYIYQGGKYVLGKNSTLKIAAKDYISGVEKTYYSFDRKTFKPYESGFVLPAPGRNTVYFFSVDQVGNISDTAERVLYADFTPPEVQLKVLRTFSDTVLGETSYIKLIANDEHGTKAIYYKTGEMKSYKLYSSPISARYFSTGRHVIYYYAVDRLDNQSQVFMHEFIIDREKPQIDYQVLGDKVKKNGYWYVSPNSKIQLDIKDNTQIAEIKYSTNNSKYTSTGKTIDLSKMSGYQQICVFTSDVAGNVSTKCFKIFVDNTQPKTSITFAKPEFVDRDTTFITSKTLITLQASDSYSGIKTIEYALNNMDFKPYDKPFTIEKEGLNILYYRAKDNVGNIEDYKSRIIYVDNTPPDIEVIFSVEPYNTFIDGNDTLSVFPEDLTVYLSSTDDKTGERVIYYSINGSKKTYYRAPIKLHVNERKIFTLHVESADKLNNRSQKTVKFVMAPNMK